MHLYANIVVAHAEWEDDQQMVFKLYRSLISLAMLVLSINLLRGSTSKSFILYTTNAWLVLGALRTSQVDSLYIKAHEAPLQLRLWKTSPPILHKTQF